jgi:MFS family permease
VLAVYGIVCIITVNLMGFSGDRFGNRPTFALSYLLLAVAFFWILAAKDAWQMYVFAIILGLSYGGMQVLFSPLVAELFGLKSHGVILGAVAIGGSLGAASGPIFAGYTFDITGSYTLAFTVCAILGVVALVLTLLLGGWRRTRSTVG